MKYDIRKHISKHMDRLMRSIDKENRSSDDCWPWTGPLMARGSGLFNVDGHRMAVHRVIWTIDRDQWIPEELFVLHTCENKLCCNPEHLYLARRAYTHGEGIIYKEVPEWDLRRYRAK